MNCSALKDSQALLKLHIASVTIWGCLINSMGLFNELPDNMSERTERSVLIRTL